MLTHHYTLSAMPNLAKLFHLCTCENGLSENALPMAFPISVVPSASLLGTTRKYRYLKRFQCIIDGSLNFNYLFWSSNESYLVIRIPISKTVAIFKTPLFRPLCVLASYTFYGGYKGFHPNHINQKFPPPPIYIMAR